MIRDDPGISGSPIDELEKMGLDTTGYFRSSEIKEKYKIYQDSVMDRSFIALAAPSFEGKTQSAFVFKNLRPLYFVANSQLMPENNLRTQSIYKNYRSISVTLLKFANDDYNFIKKDGLPDGTDYNSRSMGLTEKDLEFFKVSGQYLEANHMRSKFWVLGLFKKLIEDAKDNYDQIPEVERPEWMDYHSRSKDLLVESVSIEDLKKDASFFKGYCVFLDEFTGDVEKVLIRNFSRIIGLRCIVANTNAVISNLTGKVQSAMSRESGLKDAWSIVFTRLNPVSRYVMINYFNICELMGQILLRCLPSERAQFEYFADVLSGAVNGGKITLVRPGLMSIVIECITKILEIQSTEVITIREFIEKIVSDLRARISATKTQIRYTVNGVMANLSLLTLYAYEFEVSESFSLCHRKSFLADHLFYLINPVQKDNCLFFTYQSSMLNGNLRIFPEGDLVEDCEWEHEYTRFKYEDILTSLACTAIAPEQSIRTNLVEAISLVDAVPQSVSDLANPVAISLNGNHLEVLVALAIIDSSRLGFDKNRRFSLAGQSGIVFIKNILSNCILADGNRKSPEIQLNFSNMYIDGGHEFNLERFLMTNFKVPFLCPFNCQIPEILGNLNSINPTDNSIHVGTYHRAPDNAKVDAVFDVYFSENSLSELGATVVECKNWNQSVHSGQILEILKNTLALEIQRRKVSFIFCNSITSPEENHAPLYEFCNQKEILIYRFYKDKNSTNSLTFIPYHKEMNFETQNPAMLCFVFELDEINKLTLTRN